MSVTAFGVDLGTTNTVVVKATAPDALETLQLGTGEDGKVTHPSVFAFEPANEDGPMTLALETGRTAISLAARYPADFRYVQSFKSHAASSAFAGTTIFGKRFELGDIFACFLRQSGIADLIRKTEGPKKIIVGRPVVFHGDAPDDALAISRYRAGFAAAGIEDFELALEPIGAAFSFFRSAEKDVRVLIADFGGGTSDFIVARFRRNEQHLDTEVLAHGGVGIAGDAFDARIIENALVSHFGAGTTYRENGKDLPVPRAYFAALARWHQMTQLRAPSYMRELQTIRRSAEAPQKLDSLIYAIEHNQGLSISRAVSAAKAALSSHEEAELTLDLETTQIAQRIKRSEFETWIAPDIQGISRCLDGVLNRSTLEDADIDRVFLTGGTSFVPAVHALFTERFGEERVQIGDRFSAVAEGLALIGQQDDSAYWTEGS